MTATGRAPRAAGDAVWSGAVWSGAAGAALVAAHTVLNTRRWRRPPPARPVGERVSVLLPVRDEAARVGRCLTAVLASTGLADLEVIVHDDASTDATADLVAAIAAGDPRVVLQRGEGPPDGWLGKPHACHRAATAATGTALVFVDADVTLAADGLARAVALLRDTGLDLVSPYPRQEAVTAAERLVQPLLQWSFLALLPLRLAERSPRGSLSAAGGQLLCVDAAAYRRAGGHAAVRAEVLEDIALLRAVKRAGGRGCVADGTELAVNRMYTGAAELRDGYAKSLWAAGGGRPAASAGQVGLLGWLFVLPVLAALRGSWAGLAGYLAGVASRWVTARATAGRAWPDAAAHPLSICALGWLTALSWWRRHRGTLRWKNRHLP
ncbi:glycosyltransferase [Frankia sp. CNm7]|uniref:Glycosyltransferase n=1 Tax=Frankia nepalensis TaxID=1836974 RepID=A0A937UU34_9ACTN|nr:glycosyltransferase family 2 protein [Frankia nepalensis]MBL7501599.1 glycosyltransferase [Frankia nepalensis]MBL7513394.1 glycosyltransferase [Frankia nepalensis]MBL7521987.1 glycosyltransferase [Frankia nepalensis]MBL7633688.1 glycosyltransferase [Frankia nepalensis]